MSENKPDLSKLTVPQLKALCKERRITGYSKLGKNALLQKLTESGGKEGKTATPIPHAQNKAVEQPVAVTGRACDQASASVAGTEVINPPTSHVPTAFVVVTVSRNPEEPSPLTNTVHQEKPTSLNAMKELPIAATTVTSNSNGEMTQQDASADNESTCMRPILSVSNGASESTITLSRGQKRPLENAVAPEKPPKTARIPPIKVHERNVQSNKVRRETQKSSLRIPVDAIVRPPVALPARPLVLGQHKKTMPPLVLPLKTIVPSTAGIQDRGFKAVPNLATVTSKRFRPLVVGHVSRPQPTPQNSGHIPASAHKDTGNELSTQRNYVVEQRYLDFPASPTVCLSPIVLPPKLSQRKYVHRWTIVLSKVYREDHKSCALVSRMFRYAIYLSAEQILDGDYGGARLDAVITRYPPNATNLWPYLSQRENELLTRKRAYGLSYLGGYFKTFSLISSRLWTSPDHDKQVTIALRFITTRLWFALSVGGAARDPLEWTRSVIEDAQQIIEGEIWCITVQTRPANQTNPAGKAQFYVLESTCEVIGCPLIESPSGHKLRADWSAYVDSRQAASSLLDHLRWANAEEYDRGISKLWLKRTSAEGDVGLPKREVAERYVMACVVSNSVSGEWMSTNQMAQEFAGLGPQVDPAKKFPPRINLYLPAHHHVESVHFTSASRRPLHPALAVVQTPDREYFVLKDNGMQVGCEEDGVGNVWMQVLGCSNCGSKFDG